MEINAPLVEKLLEVIDCGLTRGLGEPRAGGMCVEAAVCFALGEEHSDTPSCVSPPLRALKISLNDFRVWPCNKARANGLRRLAVAQLGSDTIDNQVFVKGVALLLAKTIGVQHFKHYADLNFPSKDDYLRCAALCASANEATLLGNVAQIHSCRSFAQSLKHCVSMAHAPGPSSAMLCIHCCFDALRYADIGHEEAVAFAEGVVQVLIKINAPGTAWLFLTEVTANAAESGSEAKTQEGNSTANA